MPSRLVTLSPAVLFAAALTACAPATRAADTASLGAPREWGPKPRPETVPAAASLAAPPAPTRRIVHLGPEGSGCCLGELLDLIQKRSGISILYDSTSATFRETRIDCILGSHDIDESELFDWLQAVLSYRKLVLVPVGPKSPDGRPRWLVMEMADPTLKGRPVYLDESDLEKYADRDGLYVVTTLHVRDTVDTARARDSLSPLCTPSDFRSKDACGGPGIGRIRDLPGTRDLIVGDFAPVVAAMKRVLDVINANTPPLAGREPAPATKAEAK